jgi:IS5 family transposase
MKQMTFADAEYAGKGKQTRKELFLIEMDQVVPWKGRIALIEPLAIRKAKVVARRIP